MKSMAVLLAGVILLGPAPVGADDSDDTLKFYLSKSDLVVLGRILNDPLAISGRDGVPNYICEFKVSDVLKGDEKLKGETIRVNIVRRELNKKDKHPLIKKDAECILFLKKADNAMPSWETADFWFGIQYPSPVMAKSLKRLAAPEAVFEDHMKAGTVFEYATAREFFREGKGEDYARLIEQRWKGIPVNGVSLRLEPLPGFEYRVGEKFDCEAILTNKGGEAGEFNVGGNCGMTHALGILVVPPKGGSGMGYCRGKVGGPHCFCKQETKILKPGESTKLMTGFASDAAVEWKLDSPGKYLIIGTYTIPRKEGGIDTVYSAPLVIEVMERNELKAR